MTPDGTPALPERPHEAAKAAYRNWRIGDDGEGRLHAALLAYAAAVQADADQALTGRMAAMESAIRVSERERTAGKLAEIEAHAPAIVDALRHALAYVEHVPNPSSQAAAERYRSALAVIGSEQEK